MVRRTAMVLVVLALAFVVPACGDDDEPSASADASGTTGGGSTVDVTLQEFAVGTTPAEASAGTVTFSATNQGPEDEHELVVIATDLAADALPTNDDGSVNEDGDGIEVIGEIEEFPVGSTETADFELDAGSYVLICNILQDEADGTTESHYQEGMRTAFTVT